MSGTNDTLFGRPIIEADIGLGDVGDITFGTSIRRKVRIVSQQDNGDGTWTIGVVFEDEPCPQHPSDTSHTGSVPGETTPRPAPSVDTDDDGTGKQRNG